jgi:hypothetical protein
MRTVKNVLFVTNLKRGTCLLFDRKGLGYKQTQRPKNQLINKNWLQRLQLA